MGIKNKSSGELLRLTLICSLVSSLAVLLIPILGGAEKLRAVIVPIIFWAGLIAEQIMFRFFAKSIYNEKGKRELPGAVSFFKTEEGRKTDIVLIISLVLLILFTVIQKRESIIQYILIFIVILSFRLHSVFNGKYCRLWKKKGKKAKVERKDEEENASE